MFDSEVCINSHRDSYYSWLTITIKDSVFISISHLQVDHETFRRLTFNGINILGSSHFNHIALLCDNRIKLLYNETHTNRKHHVLILNDCGVQSLDINMLQKSYKVTVKIANGQVLYNYDCSYYHFISAEELGISALLIMNYQFISNCFTEYFVLFVSSSTGSVYFIDCKFINNTNDNWDWQIQWPLIQFTTPSLMKLNLHVKMEIINCKFASQTTEILQVYSNVTTTHTTSVRVFIKNTSFIMHTISRKLRKSDNNFTSNLFTLSHTTLYIITRGFSSV